MTRRIVVTVGMGRWPFDRLLRAVAPLAADSDLFVQRGTSDVPINAPSPRFVAPDELRERMADADVVICHAGNTVRLVQRLGKVPICVAREAARGEMANDHQVRYLRIESQRGRAVGLWGDLADMVPAVERHGRIQAELLANRPLSAPPDLDRAWRLLLHELTVELTTR